MQLGRSEDIKINSDGKTMQNGQSEDIESLILTGKLCKLWKLVKVEFWRENYANWSKTHLPGLRDHRQTHP